MFSEISGNTDKSEFLQEIKYTIPMQLRDFERKTAGFYFFQRVLQLEFERLFCPSKLL